MRKHDPFIYFAAFCCSFLLLFLGRVLPVEGHLHNVTASKPKTHVLPSPEVSPILAKGRLLIASKKLQDLWFKHSVVLLIEHTPSGSMGLIINRPTTVKLADLIKDMPGLENRQNVAFFGGPVEGFRMFLLVRSKQKIAGALQVMDELHMTTSRDTLEKLASGRLASNFHAYAGYAGWSAGQLDAEIAQGGWFVSHADAKIIFERDPKTIWEELVRGQDTMQVSR